MNNLHEEFESPGRS